MTKRIVTLAAAGAAIVWLFAWVPVYAAGHHGHPHPHPHPAPSPTPSAVVYCQRFCEVQLPCPPGSPIPLSEPVLGPGGVVIGYQCPVPQF